MRLAAGAYLLKHLGQVAFHVGLLPRAQRMPTSHGEPLKTELDSQFQSAVKVDMIPEIPTSPTEFHNVGILDLPNEIIIFILEDLEDDELFSLSLLSRQLHHLALPVYLSRNGISSRPNSQLLLFDDRSNSILKALNAALFTPTLNSLLCALHCHKHPDDLFRQMLMLNRLVGKVSTLNEASINFDKVNQLLSATEEIVMSRFFGDIGDPAYGLTQEFGRELTVMMESILASGCHTYTISHSGAHLPSSDGIKAAVLANFYGLQFIKKKVTRLLRPLFPKLCPTTNTLKTFNLHSPIAIHPHLCRWTINTLNNSHLTSLSISQNRSTESSVWSLILPCITISSLSHLSIDLCSIKTGDLFKFLRRHPLIQNLFLGRNILLPNPSQTLIKNALKHLSHLTAHPKWLVHLLTPQGCLPSLSCIRILWRIQNKQHFSFVTLNGLLEPVARRLGSIKELHLVLSFGSISSDWMVPNSTCGSNSPPLTCVTHLELHIGTYSLPLAVATRLPKWLAEFPALEHLKIVTMSEAGPFGASEKTFFVRSVLASCPKLDHVEFGVQTVNVQVRDAVVDGN
ncbi:hypothetical protein BYT27DRAFT_7183341 [Phlegmacium glaucopus]|nr:hypothetical protein BYT27DRAFT_7183341 [Phlegmacium glaucopus]